VLFNELKRRKRLLDEAAAKAVSTRDAPADALLPGGAETLPEGAMAPPAAFSPRRAFAPRAEEAPLPPRASAPSAAVSMTLTASLAAAALAAAPGASGAARVSADNGVIARAREAARERREPSRGRAAARDGDKENSARFDQSGSALLGAREESAGPHGRAAERAERESAREPLGAGAAGAANAAAGAAEESERAAALQRRLAADSKRQAIYGQLFGKRPASGGSSARGDEPAKEHATAEHSGPPQDAAPVRLNGRRLVAPTVQDLDSSLDSPPHAVPRAVRAQ
jgi:hypothetical protein